MSRTPLSTVTSSESRSAAARADFESASKPFSARTRSATARTSNESDVTVFPMRRLAFLVAVSSFTLALTDADRALALNPDGSGWYHTGDAVRQKTVLFV